MKKILSIVKHWLMAIMIPLILYIVLLVIAPQSVGGTAIFSMMQQAILPAILAWGVVFALKMGIWNYAIGATVLFAAIIGGNLAKLLGAGVVPTILIIVAVASLVGLVTGVIFILMRIPSVIVSIGLMMVFESLCATIFRGGVILDRSFQVMSSTPVVLASGFACLALAYITYSKTKFGYHLRAVGSNIVIAKQQGINVDATRIICFGINGLFAGLYAVMMLGRSCVQTPITNMGSLDMVFSAIICGFMAIAIEKHVNLMIGVYIGSLTMQLIKLGIVSIGISGQFNNAVIAIVLLIFCAANSNNKYIAAIRHWKPFSRCSQTSNSGTISA